MATAAVTLDVDTMTDLFERLCVRLAGRPEGQAKFATLLREHGWHCTPPASKPATATKPARRRKGG